ncbi:two-component sensor histidine kinase [Luteitalea sp. TBR-22]|uniref:sensor histidine kinase n=1 Tax=Luteitalea sp. TBR-22 TaxID=2802971 RepID=UPI001AF35E5B|nr:HAMP domain-containing sensor histidine kinase [Luteitalea sp. TBR-22]BCS31213.1 two-component sensor histidine kinase [Luteitalea sp. TBR-22]
MSSRWSDRLRHALALRLGLWYFGLFLVSAAALLGLSYVLVARTLADEDHGVLEDLLSRYAAEYRRAGPEGLQVLMEADTADGRHERLLVRAMTPGGDLLYLARSPDLATLPLDGFDDALARRRPWSVVAGAPGPSVLEVGTLLLPDGVAVQIGRSSAGRDALLARFRSRLLELALGVVLIALAGGVLITATGLAPLRALEATVREILETGRLDARVTTTGSRDALDRVGVLINQMLARMDALVGGMRGTLDNVAHDLRTPLTRFRTIAERALVKGDDGAALDALATAVEEADRLSATLTALMDISEAETGSMRLAHAPVPVRRLIDDAVALFSDEAEDKGLRLSAEADEALVVMGDMTRLRQALVNLIENAVKYTPPGGQVEVQAQGAGDHVVVSVRDTGDGIPPEDLPHVFDRLYRGERSRSTRGLGLGLSLVKAIVEAHGGQVSLRSAVGEGTRAEVVLPLESRA